MKYSKSQLRAISYAYSRKRAKEVEEAAKDLGIDQIYKWQGVFKTLRGFKNAFGSAKFGKAVKQAEGKLIERRGNVVSSLVGMGKDPSDSSTVAQIDAALAQISALNA